MPALVGADADGQVDAMGPLLVEVEHVHEGAADAVEVYSV